MKISKINQIKMNCSNSIKYKNIKVQNIKSNVDSFKGSKAKKAEELYDLMDGKVKNPTPFIKEFMQYTGDDYEAAKILAGSIKEDKNGPYFALTEEDKQKIKWLEPECPYLQNCIENV